MARAPRRPLLLAMALAAGCSGAVLNQPAPADVSPTREALDTSWYWWTFVNKSAPGSSFNNGQCVKDSDYRSEAGWDEDWAGGPWGRGTLVRLPVDARFLGDSFFGPVKGCANGKVWYPRFQALDEKGDATGQVFWFHHLQHPDDQGNGWLVAGHDYNAGTAVGLIGGSTCSEGHPDFSSGDHGCVVTPEAGPPPCEFLPPAFVAQSDCKRENGNPAYPNPLCGGGGGAPQPSPEPGVVCPGRGDYCGSDGVKGGAADTLYHCPGAGQAPSSSQGCASGCRIEAPGVPDTCRGGSCGAGQVIEGIDVSEYQQAIDWTAVGKSGVGFAIARIGDGTYVDPTFETNWAGIKAAGLIRGAYQFFRAADDPAALAKIVVEKVGKLGPGDLPVTIDVEGASFQGVPPATVANRVAAWIAIVQEGTGKTPMIYTGYYAWKDGVGSAAFGANPLWIAAYGSCPLTPAGWTGWRFWQYSSTGRPPGINHDTDLDRFNGSAADLTALASGGVVAPAPQGARCPGAGDYCGSDGVTNGDPSLLYHCPGANQSPTSETPCAHGCQTNPPGTPDVCAGAPPPLLRCPGGGDYCGSDGVTGGDAKTLYHCPGAGQAPSSSTPCPSGCQTNPPGTPDVCKNAGPAISCPGKGAYCGKDGVQGGAADTLYQCPGAGQAPSSSQACANGCQTNPPGTPDVCKNAGPAPSCPGKGAYCGNDGVANGASNTLYQCPGAGQAPTSSQVCAKGCKVNPPGVPDVCN